MLLEEVQNLMLLKITFQNQLKALSFLLLVTLLMLAALWWLEFVVDAIFIFAIGWIISALPTAYLHAEYFLRNRKEVVLIGTDEITVKKNGKQTLYLVKDIKEIIVYMSPNKIAGRNFQLLPIEGYHFGRIKIVNGDEVIITSLLTPDVREVLKALKIERYFEEERLFCTLLIKE